MLRDIRHAARSLARDRAFTATVVLTIAVCIAANSATFAIVSSVLLRPLPVPESDSILLMANSYPGAGVPQGRMSSGGDYYDRLRDLTVFEEQAMYSTGGQTVEIDGTPQRLDSIRVTPSLLRLLRTPPAIGRAFDEDEGEIGADRKVILSHSLWQQLYGGDSSVLGRELRLSGRDHTIVGVMPPGFTFVDPEIALWTPLAFSQREKEGRHSNNWFHVGRLKRGATLEQAKAQLDALNAANMERFPQFRQVLTDAGFHTDILRLQDLLVRDVKGILYLLWGGALFVLLIGALNIANLATVRLTLRRKELATRRALGAAGAQVMRQFILENVFAAFAGGVLGVGLGAGLLHGLRIFGLEQLPRANEIQTDVWVIAASLGASIFVGFLIGCAPIGQAYRLNLSRALQEEGRGGTSGRTANKARATLVAAQIGFAFVLLVGAGLLLASFRQLLHVDPGFNTKNVLTASTIAPSATYPEAADRRALVRRALEAARALPGVVQAGATSAIPLGGSTSDSVIFAEDYQMKPGESVISPRQVRVTPGYFEAMEIGLVRGRYFDASDDENATPAIIVDEKLAERFWPDEDPLGRRMYQPQDINDLFKVDEDTVFYTVVGVVRNIRPDELAGEGSPVGTYYFAFAQSPQSFFTIAARTAGAPESLIRPLQAELAVIDPELALFDVRTMEQRAELSLSSRRTAMTLAMGFGAVALFLAAIGVYGVLAFSVSQRKREIGIRVALGSTAAEVARLVVRQGLAVAGAGLLLGGLGAIGLQRVIANEIYGVGATDPAVLGAVVLLMAIVAATASLLPALRASRIDPLRALSE